MQSMARREDSVRADLEAYGQEHLLQLLDKLEASERDALYHDIKEVNLKKLWEGWKSSQRSQSDCMEVKDEQLIPLGSSIVGSTIRDKGDVSRWMQLGKYRSILVLLN